MSSKITKRMISRVDEMVSQASSATQQQPELGTKKRRKTARRALLGALSSKRSSKTRSTTVIGKSDRREKTLRKKARSNGPRRSLLEDAKRELRGKSKAARNVSLLTYSRQQRSNGVGAKSQRAVEQLLLRDQAASK